MSVSVKISSYRELLMIFHFFLIIYSTTYELKLHLNCYDITSIIEIEKTPTKERIKEIAKNKMDKIESKMKEVMAAKRKSLGAEKRKKADTSVRFGDV